MKKRVVVTGLSCITPIGVNADLYWKNSLDGRTGIKRIEEIGGLEIPASMSRVVGAIDDFEPLKMGLEPSELKYDRAIQFALAAVSNAVKLSEYNFSEGDRVNVHLSTAIGNIDTMETILKEWSKETNSILYQKEDLPIYLKKSFEFNNIADVVADKYNIQGEVSVLATGCTGGVDAIGYSFEQIRENKADVIITGSAEAPITPLVISSFSKIGATTKNNVNPGYASRPFDLDRDGFVLAEGCGILILESLEHALDRNAPIFGEIVGYGSCSNALHMTDIPIDGKEICKSMKLALEDAGITPESIDYVNLHGSSTPQNDYAERNALKNLFAERYSLIPVTSNKSQVGHALSASNSIEIISCLKTLLTNIIPPTNNLVNKDPECDLNVIQTATKLNKLDYILKNSSGFSGIHSSIVLKKFDKERQNDCC